MSNMNHQEVSSQELQNVNGGNVAGGSFMGHKHTKGSRTGREREDSRWIFFSQHQYEYICSECGEKFWADEERN